MKKIAMAVLCGNPIDTTSFYRGMGPLGTLSRNLVEFQMITPPEYSWASLKLVHAVFMQRPFTRDQLQIAKLAKVNGKKLWVDYDDYLLAVPVDNPTVRIYDDNAKMVVRAILGMADVITVSTEFLAELLRKETKAPVTVIPNAFDDGMFKWRQPGQGVGTQPIIAWRGTDTHVRDLMEVAQGFVDVNRTPDIKGWKFEFWGYRPFFIMDALGDRVDFHPTMDVIDYHGALTTSAPRIMVVPLSDSVFNRAKSNVAWLEGCMAGAVVVAPDWDEWKRPGIINYAGPHDFGRALLEAMRLGQEKLEKLNYAGWKEIQARYTLSRINGMRETLLWSLR